MIPKINELLGATLTVEPIPSRTYGFNLAHGTIAHYCDKLEAMRQLVYKIVNTERYNHIIYSWDYGIELNDLFGEPSSDVCPEIERRIIEALTLDQRIQSVGAFVFETIEKGKVHVSFTVHTVFGAVKTEKVVTF